VAAVLPWFTSRQELQGAPVTVQGVQMETFFHHASPRLLDGAMPAAGEALINTHLARRLTLHTGDVLEMPGARLRIAGVLEDYGSFGGAVWMDASDHTAVYGAVRPARVDVILRSPPDASALQRLTAMAPGQVVSSADERERIVTALERFFILARLLTLVALMVAAAGVSVSLHAGALDQLQHFALLRVLGAERATMTSVMVLQALWTALVALLVGCLAGMLSARLILASLMSQRTGWPVTWTFPAETLLLTAAVLVPAAGLAALAPARFVNRVSAKDVIRL